MGKHKKKNHKHRVTKELMKQVSLLVKQDKRVKLPLQNENAQEDTEDDLQIVDEINNSPTLKMETIKKEKVELEVKHENQGSSAVKEDPVGSTEDKEKPAKSSAVKEKPAGSSEHPDREVRKQRSRSSSSSASSSSSESSSSDVSSSTISSSSSSMTSSSSDEKKKRKKKGKRSNRSKRSRKPKKYRKKSPKISSKKESDTSPNLYAQYNKVAGQQIGKKERKVLQEASAGFKPYPKTSGSTKNKEDTVIRGRKSKKKTFFCLPHALSESVPPFREWTRLIGYGVGQKVIQVHHDASSAELVETLYKEFPALNGVQFSYGKARNGLFSDDDIIDNSANMATLKSAIGCTGNIFIIPHQDLLLPTDPVGISEVKCPDCGEDVLSCDSREHAATHLRDDTFFRPEGAKKTYLGKVGNKVDVREPSGKIGSKGYVEGSSGKIGSKGDVGGALGKVGSKVDVGGPSKDVE